MASSGVPAREPLQAGNAAGDTRLPAPPEPVVGSGCRFEGVLTFRGEARIEGEFRGEVSARGTLRVGEGARVEASVDVDELIVSGEFEGEARARKRIELRASARVRGSLEAPRVRLDEGCVVRGSCRTAPAGPV